MSEPKGEYEVLKPCPFCGEIPSVKFYDGKGYKVVCPNILCVSQTYGHPSQDDAMQDWNRRI